MKNKRDASVELARIFACMIVIGVHSCLSAYDNESYIFKRVFIECLFADGVAVFWLIMGSFLFKNTSYKKLGKRTFKNTGLPMIGFSIIVFYTAGWLVEGKTLLESVSHVKEDYIWVFRTLIAWENPVSYLGHLWYLYIYFVIILIFPALNCFVKYLDEDSERTKWFLILSFTVLAINDVADNRLGLFSHHFINAAVPASIEVIWGHILYKNKNKFVKKYMPLLSVILFLTLNIFRAKVQFGRYQTGGGNHILYWYTGIGLICAICLIVFCFGVMENAKQAIDKKITFIAMHTFSIYLLHPLVIAKMRNYNIQGRLYQYIIGIFNIRIGEFLYTGILVLLIFLICMGISLLFYGLKRLICFICIHKDLKNADY